MPQLGFNVVPRDACVKTVSPGSRLTRPAPARSAFRPTPDMPLCILRTLPVSFITSGSLNLRGGAKSRPVKVLDLRSKCLSKCEHDGYHRWGK